MERDGAGPRILVVEHEDSCPPALVGEWLTEAGCSLEVRRPYLGDDLPGLTSYDGVLVLGGEMGAHDDAQHAWLGPLKSGIREAVAAGTPVLGICLGHQLMAVALGGTVVRNPRGRTVGLRPVGWTEEAATDDWVGGRTGDEQAIHWNNDVAVELPDGAVVLARTPDGEVQVARFGPRAWGTQAHPEAHVDIIRRWVEDEREDEVDRRVDEDAVLAAIDEATPRLVAAWRPITERFAELVAEARR